MGLTAATYLGDNTVAMLDGLIERLRGAGVDIGRVGEAPGSSDDAVRDAGGIDLLWACGLLTAEMIAAGQIDADIVAAPVFAGQPGPVYHSVIVVRADAGFTRLETANGLRLAINESASWSGHHGLAQHLAEIGRSMDIFDEVIEVGSHQGSALMVARREADVAAIDHTVWDELMATGQDIDGLAVIGRTRNWPAPPFSISNRVDRTVRARIIEVLAGVDLGDIEGLDTVVSVHAQAYDSMRSRDQPGENSASR